MILELEEIKKIIDIIEADYFFADNFERWKLIKETIEKDNMTSESVDERLSLMGDMHLRLLNVENPKFIHLCDLNLNGEKILLFNSGQYMEVEKINNMQASEILQKYQDRYPLFSMRQAFMIMQQDMKVARREFEGDITIVADGESHLFHKEPVESLRKQVDMRKKISPVFLKRIGDTGVLIKIITFDVPNIYLDFVAAMKDEMVKKAHNVIFDLRDNCGGKIDQTKKILEWVINSDFEFPYVIKDKNGKEYFLNTKKGSDNCDYLQNKRFFVFVNENTASAAEYVFANGLKLACSDRTIIVGKKTVGLSGQARVYAINEQTLLNVTVKRYFDIFGNELQSGIIPDIEIDNSLDILQNRDVLVDWYIAEEAAIE